MKSEEKGASHRQGSEVAQQKKVGYLRDVWRHILRID